MTTTNPPSDGVARDLENAATLLREMGWLQNDYYDRSGCSCVWGALYAAANLPSWAGIGHRRVDAAAAVVVRYLGLDDAPAELAEWNDAPGRTAEEVITALESAAALARASGEAS